MSDDDKRFGDIRASLNYTPSEGVKHRADSAIYVRPAIRGKSPWALDLSDAKALRDHLSALIAQVEAGIEEQRKPKQPGDPFTATTIKFEGRIPAYREGNVWRFLYAGSPDYTWDELLKFVGNVPFEILYPKAG